jgi:hypothetical protein
VSKKHIEIDASSEEEQEQQFEVVARKIPPQIEKKSKSMPSMKTNEVEVITASILKKSVEPYAELDSDALSVKSSSKSHKQEALSIQFVESVPYHQGDVDVPIDAMSVALDAQSVYSTQSKSVSISEEPAQRNSESARGSITPASRLLSTNMDSLLSLRSQPAIASDIPIEETILKPIIEQKEEKKEETPKKPKSKPKVEVPRPPWGGRKMAKITFESKKEEKKEEKPKPRKPLVPRFRRQRRRRSDDSSDSSSESEPEIEAVPEPIPETLVPTQIEGNVPPKEEVKTPIEAVRPNTDYKDCEELGLDPNERKCNSNPLTKLRLSQYNLFSSTAGPFRGPGDPYYKFVLGGRNIRQGAKLLAKHKVAEVDQGKYDEILIDKSANRYNTAAYNHRTLFKLRDRQKEIIETGIDSKVDNLEKMRAYIITMMQSLRSHKALLGDLYQILM